jgi:hypothetical protein
VPYNSGALIMKFLFTVASTDEIAETQLTLSGGPGFDAGAAFDDWHGSDLEDMYAAYGDMVSGSGMYWGSYSVFKGVKLSAVDASRALVREPLEYVASSPTQGGAAHVPPACSIVLSLRSGFTLNYANYGRMYLPHTILAQQSGHATASSSDTATVVGRAATFVELVNAKAHGMSHQSQVVNQSSKGSGHTKRVAEVMIGNVTDTQRRRRNAIRESYSTFAIPLP